MKQLNKVFDPKLIKDKGQIKSKRVIHIGKDLSWANGEDVIVYDVSKITPFVTYYIVCSASNDRRLNSLVSVAKETIYDNFKTLDHTEGDKNSKWILLDCKDTIIQLFTKEERNRVQFDNIYINCPHKTIVADSEPIYRRKKRLFK